MIALTIVWFGLLFACMAAFHRADERIAAREQIIVHGAAPMHHGWQQPPSRLFSVCPLGPRNLPTPSEREA
jgi:hypothetical protein